MGIQKEKAITVHLRCDLQGAAHNYIFLSQIIKPSVKLSISIQVSMSVFNLRFKFYGCGGQECCEGALCVLSFFLLF